MIKLEIINNNEQNFLISADEPIRVEICRLARSKILAYVYRRTKINQWQEPVLVYDGTVKSKNGEFWFASKK